MFNVSKMVLLASLMFSSAAWSAEIQVGAQIEPMTLQDQHEKNLLVDASTRFLIFAREKEANQIITSALETSSPAFLADKKAVYVADISGMPSLITKLFALPKMRKYPYRVALDREAQATKDLPTKPKQVTLIQLNQLKVEKIDYYSQPEELKKALGN